MSQKEDIASKFKALQDRLSKAKERFSAIEGERKVLQEQVTKLATAYEQQYGVKVDTVEAVSAEIQKVTSDIATSESEFQRIYDEFNKIFSGAGA